MFSTLLQITTETVTNTGIETADQEKLSLISLMLKGGIIMIPIGVLFLLTIFIFLKDTSRYEEPQEATIILC